MKNPILAATVCVSVTISGCSSGARSVTPANDATRAQLLDRVKQLEGTWEMVDEQGVRHTASIFTVTSNGSAVREIMFPGSDHEMTNMYHMDGPTLVVTHYCAQGNQPRMRATSTAHDRIVFNFDSVTNRAPDQMYMGGLTLEFIEPDRIVERWTSFEHGKAEHHAVFTLTRKKG